MWRSLANHVEVQRHPPPVLVNSCRRPYPLRHAAANGTDTAAVAAAAAPATLGIRALNTITGLPPLSPSAGRANTVISLDVPSTICQATSVASGCPSKRIAFQLLGGLHPAWDPQRLPSTAGVAIAGTWRERGPRRDTRRGQTTAPTVSERCRQGLAASVLCRRH